MILSKVGRMMLQDRLKTALSEANLSANKLAKLVGVSHVAVGQWLNGTSKNIKGATAIKVADALQINVDWLLTGAGPKEKGKNPPRSVKAVDPADATKDGSYVVMPLHQLRCESSEGYQMDEIQERSAVFSKELFEQLKAKPENCMRCRVVSSNMAPMLKQGDEVVFDTTRTEIESEGVYAVSNSGRFEVYKLLPMIDGSIRFTSCNEDYASITIPASEFAARSISILGKVLFATTFFS